MDLPPAVISTKYMPVTHVATTRAYARGDQHFLTNREFILAAYINLYPVGARKLIGI